MIIQPKHRTNGWTAPELEIITRLYPVGGWQAVSDELVRNGYLKRKKDAIKARAAKIGVRYMRNYEAVQTRPNAPQRYHYEWQPLGKSQAPLVREGALDYRSIKSL